jgi:hypothetical protein
MVVIDSHLTGSVLVYSKLNPSGGAKDSKCVTNINITLQKEIGTDKNTNSNNNEWMQT